MYVSIHVYIHVYIYIHMYTHMYMYTCVRRHRGLDERLRRLQQLQAGYLLGVRSY